MLKRREFSFRIVIAVSAVAILAALPAAASAHGGDSGDVAVKKLSGNVDAVRGFWTADRIEQAVTNGAPAAEPNALDIVRVPLSSGSLLSAMHPVKSKKIPRSKYKARRVTNRMSPSMRSHGLVVFTFGDGYYSCSGTVAKAPSRSLVWTAAHCMTDAARTSDQYATNWAFIPAYKDGDAPYGVWPATSLAVTRSWLRARGQYGRAGSQLDFGAAVVAPDGEQRIQSVVGSRKVVFNGKRKQRYKIYGYPASDTIQRFTGESPFFCKSQWLEDARGMPKPKPIEVACELTTGASGGAWIGKKGRIFAVNSYRTGSIRPPILGGAYLGPQARKLYNKMDGIEP